MMKKLNIKIYIIGIPTNKKTPHTSVQINLN